MRILHMLLLSGLFVAGVGANGVAPAATFYSPYVDKAGTISLPDPATVRSLWSYLGSWALNGDGEVSELHSVYTQPEAVVAFKKNGKFPDGAVIVKEVRAGKTRNLTTGTVTSPAAEILWFVMIKGSKGRFPSNTSWGDGWGWALFNADDQTTNASSNYRSGCRGCHVPARKTDWIYTHGYPVLKD